MAKETTRDLRRSPRVDLDGLRVSWRAAEPLSVRGNLSTGGVGFCIEGPREAPPNVGDVLSVLVRLPDSSEPLRLSGQVCHIQSLRHDTLYVGANFLALDVLAENPIFRFVEERALESRQPERPVITA
jgi:hypothetical protein